MWKLVIEDDEGKRTVVPLTRDDYTIGRREGNTIRLTERNISRDHVKLVKKPGTSTYVVEDLQSYMGVMANGLRITGPQELSHGDLIEIGDYRIVVQDDSVLEHHDHPPSGTTDVDLRTTIPNPPAFRASPLLERPDRFVMLVGPTPGVEYPLSAERLTIGRAEDASISVNHNSVSRLHCEVHALGEGRFEIVDKGSSNGVRINGVDLKRSIIEAGDVIELGDVRFRFVGAGQVFVPGPNESQQLTAISDRAAEMADDGNGDSGLTPFAVLGAVVALLLLAGAVYWRHGHRSEVVDPPLNTTTGACLDERCDGGVLVIPPAPPAQEITTPTESAAPVAPTASAPTTPIDATAKRTETAAPQTTGRPTAQTPPQPATTPAPAPTPTVKAKSDTERAREALLGETPNPGLARNILHDKVSSGRASVEEAKLLKAACEKLGDVTCRDMAKSHIPSPPAPPTAAPSAQ